MDGIPSMVDDCFFIIHKIVGRVGPTSVTIRSQIVDCLKKLLSSLIKGLEDKNALCTSLNGLCMAEQKGPELLEIIQSEELFAIAKKFGEERSRLVKEYFDKEIKGPLHNILSSNLSKHASTGLYHGLANMIMEILEHHTHSQMLEENHARLLTHCSLEVSKSLEKALLSGAKPFDFVQCSISITNSIGHGYCSGEGDSNCHMLLFRAC